MRRVPIPSLAGCGHSIVNLSGEFEPFPRARSVFVFGVVSIHLANNRLTPNLDVPPQELNSTELASLAGDERFELP